MILINFMRYVLDIVNIAIIVIIIAIIVVVVGLTLVVSRVLICIGYQRWPIIAIFLSGPALSF